MNTLSRGISAADFFLSVPAAIVNFLETDTQTKLVAKPQLRGQEGEKITLNLGSEIPVATTTFGSVGGAGSIATTPVSSYNYRPIGINIEVTPRVTFDADIVLELTIESSSQDPDVNIAGQNFPSFASRKVTTRIRLRDGESTLLAGLLREDDRRNYKGFPGLIHVPVIRSLFTSNDISNTQTDIVILMTPRIVRGHELTQQDVNPVYIGSQQNLGLSGPPPLIAAPEAMPASIRSGSGAAAKWHDCRCRRRARRCRSPASSLRRRPRLRLRPRRRKVRSRPCRRSSRNQRPSRRALLPTSRRRWAASSSP